MSDRNHLTVKDAIDRLPEYPWIVSHRGNWEALPENSIEAMLSAVEHGADMVEIDAQSIGDGTLVVIHDDVLDRTTNSVGPVSGLYAGDLVDIRLRAANGGPHNSPTDARLPTLLELLEAARGRVLLNIDTKHRNDLDAVAKLVIESGMTEQVLLKMSIDSETNGANFLEAPWFGMIPFMPVILDAKRGELALRVGSATGLLGSRIVEVQFEDCCEFGDMVQNLDAEGVSVWINTLECMHPMNFADSLGQNSPDLVWGRLLDLGARAIQTDACAKVAAYLARGSGKHTHKTRSK